MALDGSVSGGVPAVRAALEAYGPAPGGHQMLQWELEAAQAAIASGIYVAGASTRPLLGSIWAVVNTKDTQRVPRKVLT